MLRLRSYPNSLLATVLMMWILLGCREHSPPGIHRMMKLVVAIEKYRDTQDAFPMLDGLRDSDFLLTDDEYDILVNRLIEDGHLKASAPYLDDWGNRFRIAIDCDNDGQIEKAIVNGVFFDVELRLASCVVWSMGPDGQEELPFAGPFAGHNRDNISSYSDVDRQPNTLNQGK